MHPNNIQIKCLLLTHTTQIFFRSKIHYSSSPVVQIAGLQQNLTLPSKVHT